FAATSQLEDVALHYARKKPAGLTFIITGRNGRAVWRYCKKPKEREVLFPEGTWFRVDNVVGERIFLTEMVRHE
ncbi:MAG: hypothetical protein NTY53_24615, partial [Kiritimatiellaeota bacterium]|nr:hypothetical protein [Kiritimatiellota bacterium]